MNTYTVGQLATMAGITIRTLHHYDEIGLLPPSGRTQAGYRLYDESDVDTLRTILAYRELGLRLDEVAGAVADPTQAEAALRHAHVHINQQIQRLEAIAMSIEHALQEPTTGGTMTSEEKLAVFGDFDPDTHSAEVAERWGDTEAFTESSKRTRSYTKEDWEAIDAEIADIYDRFVALEATGSPASSEDAGKLVDEHRAHISRWYYQCTPEIHAGLGQMYAADPRFRHNIDKAGEGLTTYLSEAIAARYDQTHQGYFGNERGRREPGDDEQ